MTNNQIATMVLASLAVCGGRASAWNSPEHEAQAMVAFQLACGSGAYDPVICNDTTLQSLVHRAAAEPDYCHSFWFSKIGIEINPLNAVLRSGCDILEGNAGANLGFIGSDFGLSAQETKNILATNANHFGANTGIHWQTFQGLALEAARRFKANAQSGTQLASNQACLKSALGLSGFAAHYMTDRTAAGHAWNVDPNEEFYSVTVNRSRMVGMRGCIHKQSWLNKIGINIGTGFDCYTVNPFNEPAYPGLGEMGRRFSGQPDPWFSDDQYGSAPASQFSAAVIPTVASFREVLALLSLQNQVQLANYTPQFVDNAEMCKVVINQCCRGPSSGTLYGGCGCFNYDINTYTCVDQHSFVFPDPSTIQVDCTFCDPDISAARIQTMCPLSQYQLASDYPTEASLPYQNYPGLHWVKLPGGGDITWTGQGTLCGGAPVGSYSGKAPDLWEAFFLFGTTNPNLDPSYLADSGSEVARTIATPGGLRLHPDAQWDVNHKLVDILGCSNDVIPPVTTATTTPAANAHGWNHADVSVSLASTDNPGGSGVKSISYNVSVNGSSQGAKTVNAASVNIPVTAEGKTVIVFFGTDVAGNVEASKSITINLDKTPPTVRYNNVAVYTVDQILNVQCTAEDALSGIATSDCKDITGPAYNFNIGPNVFQATAVDNADNTFTGYANFEVRVTAASLASLTAALVPQFGTANSLIKKLLGGGGAGPYINELQAQSGKHVDPGVAALLIRLAGHL